MSTPCIPATVLDTFPCHPFIPPSSQCRDDCSYFTDENTEAQISNLASGRPSIPTWLCQKSWWGLGRPRLSWAEAPGRTFSERSLQTGPCRPSPHHLGDFQSVPGWLDQLQKGWGVGTWSSCREPEEVTSGAVNAEGRRGLGMCWHLPHLGPDPGIPRGRVGKHQGADW